MLLNYCEINIFSVLNNIKYYLLRKLSTNFITVFGTAVYYCLYLDKRK